MVSAVKSSSDMQLVIAVDFGVTATAVAFACTAPGASSEPTVIKWYGGGSGSIDQLKTPSRISYENNSIMCGFDIPPGQLSYGYFKLALDDKTETTGFDDAKGAAETLLQLPPRKGAVQVTTDYLRYIHEHTFKQLQTVYGESGMKCYRKNGFRFVFTVPVSWGFSARKKTREAAVQAGFTDKEPNTLQLIAEPEAAALATILEIQQEHPGTLKKGKLLMNLDAGGGTVDINCFKVKDVTPEIQLEQLIIGKNAKSGSTAIDREFQKHLERLYKDEFTSISLDRKGHGSRLMNEFEVCKRAFDGVKLFANGRILLFMPGVPLEPGYDPRSGEVILEVKHMVAFFRPSVTKIKDLVRSQIEKMKNRSADGLLPGVVTTLVGGYSASEYLRSQLTPIFTKHNLSQPITTRQPDIAVAKGAILYGMNKIVTSRMRSNYHYGLERLLDFEQGRDPEKKRYPDYLTGKDLCQHRMSWFLNKGTLLERVTTFDLDFYSLYVAGEKKVHKEVIYISSLDREPRYCTDRGVKELGTMTFSFDNLELSEDAAMENSSGEKCYRLDWVFKVELKTDDGLFKILASAQDVDLNSASFDFKHAELGEIDVVTDGGKEDSEDEEDEEEAGGWDANVVIIDDEENDPNFTDCGESDK